MVIAPVLALVVVLGLMPNGGHAQTCRKGTPRYSCVERYSVILQLALPVDLQFLEDQPYTTLSKVESSRLSPVILDDVMEALGPLFPDYWLLEADQVEAQAGEQAWGLAVMVNFSSGTHIAHPFMMLSPFTTAVLPLITRTLQQRRYFGLSVAYTRVAYLEDHLGLCDGLFRLLEVSPGDGEVGEVGEVGVTSSMATPAYPGSPAEFNSVRKTTVGMKLFSIVPKPHGLTSMGGSDVQALNASLSSPNSGAGCLHCLPDVTFLSVVALLLVSFGAN